MTMTINDDVVKIRREAQRKIDFINEVIKRVEVAGEDDPEFYSKRKKVWLNPFPLHSWDEQRRWLKDLKKKKIIGNFEEDQDCFYLIRPIKMLLYKERQKLMDLVAPPKKSDEEIFSTAPTRRHKKDLLYVQDLKPEIEIKGLAGYSDGTIRYQGEMIEMRSQIKDLCRLFMDHPNRMLTRDDIQDAIINADRRKSTPRITIAKYVSELHNLLKLHFKKDVIFNQKQEGWYFKP
ncbi:MAG: hypothetical protein HY093_03735 [Candidatus Liptonbacteria bacterium]|nr:hypothetical protein [Candidatus Liptonbacteria bacterium]